MAAHEYSLVYLFMIYLMMLLGAQTVSNDRMINESERMWKEAVMA
jgi:hypothetical protein